MTGSIQCQGLPSSLFEAAYIAVDGIYQEGKIILILDTEAAFNNMNRVKASKPHTDKPHRYTHLCITCTKAEQEDYTLEKRLPSKKE